MDQTQYYKTKIGFDNINLDFFNENT